MIKTRIVQVAPKMETFKKRPGTTSRGKDYEDLIVANLILKLLKDDQVENFNLSSNDDQFGAFDDVILELEGVKTYAIQLKHSNKDKNLTKRALSENQGNFSIRKHYDEYKKLTLDENTQVVLFTNLKFEPPENDQLELGDDIRVKIIKSEPDSLLNTSEDGCCYTFESDDVEFYEFFKTFVLYTNQVSVDPLKVKISEEFEDKQSFKEYIDFVTEWSIKEGRKPKLDKNTMTRVLTLCVLSQNIVSFTFGGFVTEKSKILREAISAFDIIFVKPDNLDELKRIYSDGDDELNDIDTINLVGTKYQLIPKRISDIDELSGLEKSKLLWLLGKFPLILTKEPTILCDNDKFIILSDETTKGEFQTLLNLDSSSVIYGKILDHFCINLQSTETPLRHLIEENDNFRSIITVNQLVKMTGNFTVGGKNQELPVPYIRRLISRHVINEKFLKELKDDNLVVINGKYDFTQASDEMEELEQDRQVVYITDHNQFEKVCKCYPRRRNYHYFKASGGKLEWIKSLGDIQELEEYRLSDDFCEESEFADLGDRKIEVVCADPGMGKSILMKSIKNRQETYTILIYPKEHASHLTKNFKKYILDLIKQERGDFESSFLEILMKELKVTFIWDGLDEVLKEYQDDVINLIKDLQEEGFCQVVSVRAHLKRKLEVELNTLARTIKPLDQEEQAKYIKERLGLTEGDDFITKITRSIKMIRCHNILEVPLHIYMLTQLLLQDRDKYKDVVLQDVFPISDLYSYFLDEKFNIYCHEKMKLDDREGLVKQLIETTKRDRFENYERAALNLVFKDSRNIYSSFLEEIRDNSDCCGIITSVSTDGVPTFIHQSFGEYLVAKYLVKNYKSVDIELLFTPEFINIRFFFDLLLARNRPVHLAVLYKNLEVLPKYIDNFQDLDDGGRSPLHLACSWGMTYHCLEKKKEKRNVFWSHKETLENQQIVQIFCGNCDPHHVDSIFKMDAFSYANKSLSLYPMLALARIYQKKVKDFNRFRDIYCVLLLAAKHGYTEIFDVQDVSKLIKPNLHALYAAAVERSSTSVLKRLLYGKEYKFEFGKNDKDNSIVNMACVKGNIEILRLLHHANVNFNTVYGQGVPPLYIACQHGHLEVVKMFVDEYKVDINQQDLLGNTPILAACLRGHFDIVKFLMERNVNYHHLNKSDVGILMFAALSGKVATVNYFLQAGVDARLKCKKGFTAIHAAAETDHLEIARTLIQNGAKIDAENDSGITPLYLASLKGKTQMVGLLLDLGANPHLQTKAGYTPLHVASMQGHVEIVRLLIAVQASVHMTTPTGITPLIAASQRGHSEVVKVLLAAGADVNCRNQHKSTSLHVACENGHVEVVKVLLEAGVDVSARTFFGRNAEQIAKSKKFLEIVELLSK